MKSPTFNTISPERISQMAAHALERIAFIMSEPGQCDPAALAAATRTSMIRYSGSARGEVRLHAGDGFIRVLAANLLGVEPGEVDVASHGVDALRELANILGGSVIAELGGQDQPIVLGLPEVCAAAAGETLSPGACRACLNCEGEPLFITWIPVPVALAAAA